MATWATFEIFDDHRAGKIVENLTGRLNRCGVIDPQPDVQLKRSRKIAEQHAPASLVLLYWQLLDIMDVKKLRKQRGRENPGILLLGI